MLCCTVRELESRMSMSELVEWAAFLILENEERESAAKPAAAKSEHADVQAGVAKLDHWLRTKAPVYKP